MKIVSEDKLVKGGNYEGYSGGLDLGFMGRSSIASTSADLTKKNTEARKRAKAAIDKQLSDAYTEGLLDMHFAMQEKIDMNLGPTAEQYGQAEQAPFDGLPY